MVVAAVVLLPGSRSSYGEAVTGFVSRLLPNMGVLYMAFDSKNKQNAEGSASKEKKGKKHSAIFASLLQHNTAVREKINLD